MERNFIVSSYSNSKGSCVEACAPVDSEFRAAQISGGNGGSCVEVNDGLNNEVLLRDSKVPEIHTHIGAAAFSAFVEYAAVIADRDYADAVA